MDTRYFKLAAAKEEATKNMATARQMHKEAIAQPGASEVEVRKQLSQGHKMAANDAGENLRMNLYLSHEVRNPNASARNISTRTLGSLGLLTSILMTRQVMDVVRGS